MEAGFITAALGPGAIAPQVPPVPPATPAPGDVETFQSHLQSGSAAPVAMETPEVAVMADPEDGSGKTLGEAILAGLQGISRDYHVGLEKLQVHLDGFGEKPMNVTGMMQLQVDLMTLTMQQDLTAKIADRTSQGLQTLFRNQ